VSDRPKVTIMLGHRTDGTYLRDGVVQVRGHDMEYLPEGRPAQGGRPTGEFPAAPIYTAQIADPPYDGGEVALSSYFQAVDRGLPLIAIPVVTSRFFDNHQLMVRRDADIRAPLDLLGKRVLCGSWGQNPGVRLRAMLQHQYGVPMDQVTWIQNREEHFLDFHAPEPFTTEALAEGETAAGQLDVGKLDALHSNPAGVGDHPRIKPMWEDPYPEIAKFVQLFGFYPINTVVMLKRATVERAPDLPTALYEAFQSAMKLYQADLASGKREAQHGGNDLRRLEREAGIGYGEHGMAYNRTAIETMLDWCFEQGIVSRKYRAEEMFLLPDS
jgi:4,5-dihydroxyphthalate decarboxylase